MIRAREGEAGLTADRSPGRPARTTRLAGLVESARDSDRDAFDELFRLAYPSILSYARYLMRSQPPHHTLDAAGLANEAFLRLTRSAEWRWTDYGHFVSGVFQAMRHQLIDHAGAKGAQKRGAGRKRERLTGLSVRFESRHIDLLTLNEALERLGARYPEVLTVVELKFYCGLAMVEIAAKTGRNLRSAERDWAFGRKWLLAELSQ